jgi:hypothetical protein
MENEHSSMSDTFSMITNTSTQTLANLQEAQHKRMYRTANNKYKVCFKDLGPFCL